jgi:YVTN family beta-propeller protein
MRRLQTLLILFALTVGSAGAKAQFHGPLLLVINKGSNSLGIVDPLSDKQIAEVKETGITGHEVTVSPDGRFAYVPIYGNAGVGEPGTNGSTMDVIDLAQRKVVATVDFGHGVRPHLPVFGPKNHMLYVTNELDNDIAIIDPKTLKLVGHVPTGAEQSHMFVITPDGKTAYTTNVGTGSISVLDLAQKKVKTIIPVTPLIQRISLSSDGSMIFTADQHAPRVAVIDTGTDKIKQWIKLPDLGYGSTITPDGKWYIIVNPLIDKVSFVSLETMKVEHTVSVDPRPQAVVAPAGMGMVYVSCTKTGKVDVISLSDFAVKKTINVGIGADGMAWISAR